MKTSNKIVFLLLQLNIWQLSSCCDAQKNDKAIKSCRKSLLSNNSTNSNGEVRNLKSDKVALHAVSIALKHIILKLALLLGNM